MYTEEEINKQLNKNDNILTYFEIITTLKCDITFQATKHSMRVSNWYSLECQSYSHVKVASKSGCTKDGYIIQVHCLELPNKFFSRNNNFTAL